MMRKLLSCLLILLCVCACACAEERIDLPQGVLDLCSAVHPGYEIAAYDGWGDETFGQIALVLSRDGDNILCMAEKAKEDAAYAFTVDNTDAIYDGDALPSLLIDSGGDSLFYSYGAGSDYSEHYHANKQDGEWSEVDVTMYAYGKDGYVSVLAGVWDGELHYERYTEDENGNVLGSLDYPPIPLAGTSNEDVLLKNFNLEHFWMSPKKGLQTVISEDWAFVNNPDPADRLHLRERRDRESYSYGKFYNRTPVFVLERGDVWTKVRIGSEQNGLSGYMMTQYLAFDGEEKAAVESAFPKKQLMRMHYEDGVRMYSAPDGGAATDHLFEQNALDFIIGVNGEGWYIVLRSDGAAGYVPQDAFRDGEP